MPNQCSNIESHYKFRILGRVKPLSINVIDNDETVNLFRIAKKISLFLLKKKIPLCYEGDCTVIMWQILPKKKLFSNGF